MKVVISLPHLKAGGAERTASVLANFLVSKGDEVYLLLMYKREIFYELDNRVHVIEPSVSQQRVGKLLYLFYIVYFINRQVTLLKPDLVFALGYMALTLMGTLGTPSKVVLSGRSSPSRVRFPGNGVLNGVYTLVHRILRYKVLGIIAQTSRAESVYKTSYTKAKIVVIPNFLRELQLHSLAPKNQIVTVGRCEREKGHDYLIKAFAKLRADDWTLVIVGDGSYRSVLEELIKKYNLTERVAITGFQKDVDYYLAQSKIFAFTSLHEGFPNALLEAMATPLVCVSFDCEAGPSDLINHGENGFLVELKDVEGMAKYIQLLIDDERLRLDMMQKSAMTKQTYALSIIGDRYRNFFQQIIAL